jgi:hypothetical protein
LASWDDQEEGQRFLGRPTSAAAAPLHLVEAGDHGEHIDFALAAAATELVLQAIVDKLKLGLRTLKRGNQALCCGRSERRHT